VEQFLREHYQFFSQEFITYMLTKGYSARTALNWLYILALEGKIQRKMKTKRGTLYQSLMYNGSEK